MIRLKISHDLVVCDYQIVTREHALKSNGIKTQSVKLVDSRFMMTIQTNYNCKDLAFIIQKIHVCYFRTIPKLLPSNSEWQTHTIFSQCLLLSIIYVLNSFAICVSVCLASQDTYCTDVHQTVWVVWMTVVSECKTHVISTTSKRVHFTSKTSPSLGERVSVKVWLARGLFISQTMSSFMRMCKVGLFLVQNYTIFQIYSHTDTKNDGMGRRRSGTVSLTIDSCERGAEFAI